MVTPSRLAKLSGFLQRPQLAVAWPVLIKEQLLIAKRTNDLEFSAKLQLRPLDIATVAFNLVVLAAAAVMGALNLVWHILLILTVGAVLVSIVARHISYLAGSLPERFRRSGSDPYRLYVILAVCDALALLLCVSLFRSSNHQFHLSWSSVKTSALDLFTLRQIPEILSLNDRDALVSVIGLLFYSAILKAIANREQFKRTDEDLRALATASVIMGDFSEARKWLSGEQQRTATSFDTRAMIELGSGNWSKAADHIRNSLRLSDKDDDPESVSQNMSGLVFVVPISLQLRVSYVNYVVRTCNSDILAVTAIDCVVVGLRVPDESAPNPSSEQKQFASQLLGVCAEEDYPLARARLMVLNGDFGEAVGILERARPGSEMEEILRLVSACIFECANPDVSMDHTNSYVDRWLQESLPLVADLAKQVPPIYRPMLVSGLVQLSTWLDFLGAHGGAATVGLATQLADSDEQIQRMSGLWRSVVKA